MNLKATTTTVIYEWNPQPEELNHNGIILTQKLKMNTEWAKVLVVGPDSILKPGDEILMSSRPASYNFEFEGKSMNNTSDKSIIAFKQDGVLKCTCGTILYHWLEDQEEQVTSFGIVIPKAKKDRLETAWAKVVACGPESGVKPGDHILLNNHTTAYTLEIDGMKLHNAGASEVIAFYTPEE